MKPGLAAICLAVLAAAGPAAATPDASATVVANPVFTDLQALGFDLGKFRPDHTGRYPYR